MVVVVVQRQPLVPRHGHSGVSGEVVLLIAHRGAQLIAQVERVLLVLHGDKHVL